MSALAHGAERPVVHRFGGPRGDRNDGIDRRDYLFLFRGMRPMTRLASPLSATMVDLAGDKFSSTYRLIPPLQERSSGFDRSSAKISRARAVPRSLLEAANLGESIQRRIVLVHLTVSFLPTPSFFRMRE